MIRIDLTSDQPVSFNCKTGDTLTFDGFDFFSDAAKTIPLNIASDTFKMVVLDEAKATILSLSSPTNFVVSGTGNNHLKITATALVMSAVEPTGPGEPHSHYIEWTSAAGVVKVIATGPFSVEPKD